MRTQDLFLLSGRRGRRHTSPKSSALLDGWSRGLASPTAAQGAILRGPRTHPRVRARIGMALEGTLRRRRGVRGFTLLELLIVTAILGIVIGVLAACVSGGIRAWDAARRVAGTEGEAVVGLRLVEKDLMNAFLFDGIQFAGQKRTVTFPVLIRAEPGLAPSGEALPAPGTPRAGSLADRQIGEVSYRFDGKGRRLLRMQSGYGAPAPSRVPEAVLSNLRDVQFEYWKRSGGGTGGGGQWGGEWTSRTNLPDCVRIGVWFDNKPQPLYLARTVVLPLGSGPAEAKP